MAQVYGTMFESPQTRLQRTKFSNSNDGKGFYARTDRLFPESPIGIGDAPEGAGLSAAHAGDDAINRGGFNPFTTYVQHRKAFAAIVDDDTVEGGFVLLVILEQI